MTHKPVGSPWRVFLERGACVVLLAGPTALAFFSGGYFDSARVVAGLAAWVLVVLALLAGAPLPRPRSARLALCGLALLGIWTLISFLWAPVAGSAYHAGQRVILYAGFLLAATMLLRSRAALRVLEPALAAGALVVIGYGISGRLLPGLLHFQRSISALGRVEQPLTYWNAMGELAAIGLILSARVAGDADRPLGLRATAAGASAPLGMGLYLTFSRGALFACAAGFVTLIAAAPRREQLRAALVSIAAAALAAVAAAPFGGITTLSGSQATLERQGATALVLLTIVSVGAAVAQWIVARRERTGGLRLPRRAPWIALAVICAGLALVIVVGAKEHSAQPVSADVSRFETLQSSRYAYWRVALRAFGDEPLRGVGAGGWAVYWLRLRPINEFAADAHSLPLQTAAELGLVGLALLAVFLAGVVLAARDALRASVALAAGPLAGFVVWAAHAPLDWDWQMPALTLVALALLGGLLALAEVGPLGPPRLESRPMLSRKPVGNRISS